MARKYFAYLPGSVMEQVVVLNRPAREVEGVMQPARVIILKPDAAGMISYDASSEVAKFADPIMAEKVKSTPGLIGPFDDLKSVRIEVERRRQRSDAEMVAILTNKVKTLEAEKARGAKA